MDMNPHKLDDLFKGKLERPGTPPVNEVHWKEARDMLNQGNRTSKWLLGLLLLALTTGVVYYALTDLNDDGSNGLIASPQAVGVEENGEITGQNDGNEYIGIDQKFALAVDEDDLTEKSVRSHDGVIKALTDENNENIAYDTERKLVLDFQREADIEGVLPETVTSPLPLQVEAHGYVNKGKFRSYLNPSVSGADLVTNEENVPLLSGRPSIFLPPQKSTIQPLLTGAGPIQVERFSQRRVGVFGTLMLRPSQGQSPVRGLVVGATLDRFLNRTWFAGVRPSLHVKFNEPGFAKFQHNTSYSFESTNTIYGLEANSLQFARLPIYVGYAKEGHHLRLGVALEYLLAARGNLHEVEVEDDLVNVIKTISSGWIETGEMKKFNAQISAGYEYAFNRHMHLGFDIYYQSTKIFPGLPSQQSLSTERRLYLGLSALYYLK